MAGPLLQPLLLLLLSSALGSAAQAAQGTGERIINGVECPRGSHRWQVALFHNNTFQCAGVLIHPEWVLTIAHCRKSYYIVRTGNKLGGTSCSSGFMVFAIMATESFVHPRYNSSTEEHDLMLVKLRGPIGSEGDLDIDIASSCKDPGTSCTASGWGITSMDVGETHSSDLMCSTVTIISHKQCRLFYPRVLKKYMICASDLDAYTTSCKGDSGSPLVCEGSLQGLVSSGYYPCTKPFEPVIYTRLCMYRKWINNTINNNS